LLDSLLQEIKMTTSEALTPSVLWAQRPNLLFVTINVSDIENPDIKVEKDSMSFKGKGGADKKMYEVKLKFLHEVNPDTVKYGVKPRCAEFVLEKAEEGPYWSRLLEDKTKVHWLKVDFSKWKDEDDSENEEEGGGGGDLEEMMKNMGGLGGGMGGMPGMGGMGGMPGMGGMDFSGAGGLGGQPDLDDLDDNDSDDEDLPGLE